MICPCRFDAIALHLAGRGLATLADRVRESPNAWAACEDTLDESGSDAV
jgi:hypothetical protein